MDHVFLSRCLDLAFQGRGAARPNPLVGAVVVKGGETVATGYHQKYGGFHAEAHALQAAGLRARGATLYCNLEPCSFHSPEKHNGPCTEKIISAGVGRVVAGQLDPNPRVRGRGVEILREAGIEVEVADDKAYWYANARFNTNQTRSRPFVTLKLAQSLDGKIATAVGDSKWISDEQARTEGHGLRADHDAVMVGRGTLASDDPRLTVRVPDLDPPSRQPRPVVIDSRLDISPNSHLLRQRAAELLVVSSVPEYQGAEEKKRRDEKKRRLTDLGVEIIQVDSDERGSLSLPQTLAELRNRGIHSLMVEGGAALAGSFIRAGFFDAVQIYIAPIFVGGDGVSLPPLGIRNIADSPRLEGVTIRQLGDQVSLRGFRSGWLEEVKGTLKEDTDVHRIG